nr:MAG TPA: hypothetical protein [Caudoviricetes sp.]
MQKIKIYIPHTSSGTADKQFNRHAQTCRHNFIFLSCDPSS